MRILRSAIIDVLCASPPERIGARLRKALNDARGDLHPEDICEECTLPFEPWTATRTEWNTVTGRPWGGPVLCRECFDARLAREEGRTPTPVAGEHDVLSEARLLLADTPESFRNPANKARFTDISAADVLGFCAIAIASVDRCEALEATLRKRYTLCGDCECGEAPRGGG